ncbi:MAG TPA: hypothetical protein VKV25_04850, partial [Acidimicrobiales bacterium]|nr:hypothetical protein [Acidimicrobiales bacterium]
DCIGPSGCTAVGYDTDAAGDNVTLAESWDGAAWSIVPSPSPGGDYSELYGVSCSAPSTCMAAGFYRQVGVSAGLAEAWDGSAWTVRDQAAALDGIACPSPSGCVAVGYRLVDGVDVTLAESWDGHTWSTVSTPDPGGALGSWLQSVTCVTADDCWAVGYYETASEATDTLAEQWNGRSWSIVATPNPSGSVESILQGVTCTGPSACTAVGYGAGETLVESWDGSSWALVSSPNPPPDIFSELTSVSCPSASDCWAVGDNVTNMDQYSTLAEQWDGTAWSIVTTPNPPESFSDHLEAVSCPTADACLAVGDVQAPSLSWSTLAEAWNGSRWVVLTSPTPAGATYADFAGLSCPSASRCLAVGVASTDRAGDYVPYAAAYTAHGWRVTAPVDPRVVPPALNYLDAVACGASRCLATGSGGDAAGSATLSEAWTGRGWRILPTP